MENKFAVEDKTLCQTKIFSQMRQGLITTNLPECKVNVSHRKLPERTISTYHSMRQSSFSRVNLIKRYRRVTED